MSTEPTDREASWSIIASIVADLTLSIKVITLSPLDSSMIILKSSAKTPTETELISKNYI
jgi:hypothetical protein